MDYWLCDIQTAVCDMESCWQSSRERVVFIPVHFVHLRLSAQSRVMLPAEILWWFSNGQEEDCVEWSGKNHLLLNVNKTTVWLTWGGRTLTRCQCSGGVRIPIKRLYAEWLAGSISQGSWDPSVCKKMSENFPSVCSESCGLLRVQHWNWWHH